MTTASHVCSRRKRMHTLEKEFPGAAIIDLTSKADLPWRKFSPFYPHQNVPIPVWQGRTGACVEAIWQALKVFEQAGVDEAMLDNDSMKNLKRTVRRFGRCQGHQHVDEDRLLPYIEARKTIYLPAYNWVLEQWNSDTLPATFEPFSLEEVSAARKNILADPLRYRIENWKDYSD